jgi:ribosome-binding protein aMBF1 (putative translation factor)
MTTTKKWSVLRDQVEARPGAKERLERKQLEMVREQHEYTLGELRRSLGVTQVQLAEMLGRTQSAISQMESGHLDVSVSLLRALVEQLGGRLRLVADMPSGSVEINL